MKITALKYGESVFSEALIFDGGRANVLLPISFTIYLIRTEDRNILVDVGCDDGAGFPMSVFVKPVELLESHGVFPDEITDVIITHSHHDHVEALKYYSRATVYVQKDEYPPVRRYLPEGVDVKLFDDGCAVTKDVRVKKVGGHSVGSSVVVAGKYVFCGDECYYKRSLTDKICTGASCDKEKSLGFIEEYGSGRYVPLLFHDPGIMPGKVGWEEITSG